MLGRGDVPFGSQRVTDRMCLCGVVAFQSPTSQQREGRKVEVKCTALAVGGMMLSGSLSGQDHLERPSRSITRPDRTWQSCRAAGRGTQSTPLQSCWSWHTMKPLEGEAGHRVPGGRYCESALGHPGRQQNRSPAKRHVRETQRHRTRAGLSFVSVVPATGPVHSK